LEKFNKNNKLMVQTIILTNCFYKIYKKKLRGNIQLLLLVPYTNHNS